MYMSYENICINLCGEPCKVINLYNDTVVDLKGKTMMVMAKGRGQEINSFPFGPCDGNKNSS